MWCSPLSYRYKDNYPDSNLELNCVAVIALIGEISRQRGLDVINHLRDDRCRILCCWKKWFVERKFLQDLLMDSIKHEEE